MSTSCRDTQLADGRPRQFDVTAATVMAEGRRAAVNAATVSEETAADVEAGSATTPPPSRTRQLVISAGIVVAIVGSIGLVVFLV